MVFPNNKMSLLCKHSIVSSFSKNMYELFHFIQVLEGWCHQGSNVRNKQTPQQQGGLYCNPATAHHEHLSTRHWETSVLQIHLPVNTCVGGRGWNQMSKQSEQCKVKACDIILGMPHTQSYEYVETPYYM